MLSMKSLFRRLMSRPQPQRVRQPGPPLNRLRLAFESLEDRITPVVRVYTSAAETTLINTYSGVGALAAAVNDASTVDGDYIVVDTIGTSTYNSPGLISKTLTIVGPNDGIDPNTSDRVPEVDIDTTAAAGGVIQVASNVTVAIRGFSFVTPGGLGALEATNTGYSVDFSDNVVTGQIPVYRDVYLDSFNGTGYTSALISHNLFNKMGDPNHAAINIAAGSDAIVENNVILGGFNGVQIGVEQPGLTVNNPLVTNNYIANTSHEGIQVADFADNLILTDNTVVNANTANVAQAGGIRILTFYGGEFGQTASTPGALLGPGGTLTIANNLITGSNNGIFFSDGFYPPDLTSLLISQNYVTGNSGDEFNTGDVADATVDLSGNYFGTASPAAINALIQGTRPATVGAYLNAGTNTRTGALSQTSGAWGFIPDPTAVQMIVPVRSATSGLTDVNGVIQIGVDRASPGMTVEVMADTFAENVTTFQNVTLLGVGPVVIAPSSGNALTVTGGTTLLDGTFATGTGPAVVNSGGTLGGTASYAGAVTINTGGTINPGNGGTSIGTLTIGGLAFNGGSYDVDFSANTSDSIATAGPVNLDAGTPGVFVIDSESGVTTGGTEFPLINYTGSGVITNPPLTNAPEGGATTINGLAAYYTYSGITGKDFALITSGNATIFANGALTVRKDATGGASNIQLLQGNTIIDERPLASIPASATYTIDSDGGSTDSLTVDYTNSPPVPAGLFATNIAYNESGSPASLTIKNGKFGKIAFTSSSTTAETIQEYTNAIDTIPVTTITATGVSTVSDTTMNTGIAIVNLPNLLPGTGSTTFGTALSGVGVTQFVSNLSPPTTFGDPATNLAINLGAAGSLTLNKMDSSFNPSSGVQVTGSSGNDTFTVNWIASQAVTINGGGVAAGGADQVNINAGTTAGTPGSSGAGPVVLTDAGPGMDNYIVTLTGTGSGDTIDINDLNTANYTHASAPFPIITTAFGPATVGVNGTKVLSYGSTANLSALTVVETAGTNTYNIQYTDTVDTSGSFLPATVALDTTTGNDTANLIGTSNPDTIDVGYTTTGVATALGTNVVFRSGSAYVKTLNVYGRDKPVIATPSSPAIGDTFKVTPDAYTAININGGNSPNGYGDTLILNALGLVNPVISPIPALPSGMITSSNRQTVTWNSIASIPVPLGLGGTFDFQPSTSATQPGFLPVFPTDTPTSGQYANANDGWLNSGAGAYDRGATYGAAGVPDSPELATLLQTAEWGNDGGGANDGQFQVTVAPNQIVQVTAYIGDTFGSGRDLINVYVGTPGNPYESLLNPSSSTFDTFASTSYKYVSYSGMFNPGSSSTLVFTIDKPYGGTSSFWTISGLDVRPLGLVAPLSLTRADSAPFSQPQVANGMTIDTYNGSGAAPYAELTINPQYGTPYGTDIDPAVKGFQVQANALGDFTFQILRPTGSGPSLITLTDVTGASGTGQIGPTAAGGLAVSPNPYLLPNPVYQTYTLPVLRRIDFGPLGTPDASDSGPPYLVFDNSPYISTAANALGWIGTPPTTFDSGGSPNNLQRDGVYGTSSTPGDFELDMPAANTVYSVTVLLGDPVSAESGMFVEVVDPATGTIIESTPVTGANTAAGQSTSFTFPVTSDSLGRIRLRFGVSTAPANGFWTLQDVEVRPEVGTASPPLGTQADLTLSVGPNNTTYAGTASGTGGTYSATLLPGTVTANGTTSTTYTISGATPNSLITVSTTLGTLTTADAGPTYTGIQVLANGSGTATFAITAPLSTTAQTSTIAVTEVTGASLGLFTQNYTGYTPPPPPTSPPPAVVQQFDFTSGTPQTGFTAVPSSTVYTPTIGYGWQMAVNSYDRGAGSVPAPYPANLFRAGAWGEGSGTFEVSVPAGSTDDVRVYVGDPYNAWAGITVSVDGGTPVGVNAVAQRYGYVTLPGNAVPSGLLSVTISGGIWVASGVEVATTGGLPTPATGATNPITATGTRLEFTTGTVYSGFTAVSGSTLYSQGAQYGWASAVNEVVRPASEFPSSSPLSAAGKTFYGSIAYGAGSSTFEIAVQPGATYSIQVYVSDPYNAWSGISISAEGGTTVTAAATSNPPGVYDLTGQDVNGDGVLTITIGAPTWVLNGIDIVQMGNPLPTAPN